jgi:CHAD domain-containing protein
MPASFLIRHWKKELQVFQDNYSILLKTSNTDAIHDLRVAVKKLRSYYKFYSTIFDLNPSRAFVQTENLFAVLGKQRNVEICLEVLDKQKEAEKIPGLHRHFKIYLTETELRSKKALQEYNPEELKSLTTEIEKTILNEDEDSIKDKARNFFKTNLHDVIHQMHRFDETYHLVRKKLKDVFYWSKMMQPYFYFSSNELKLLDKALDRLGSCQDHEILRIQTRHYRRSFAVKGSQEFESLKELDKLIKDHKQKLLDEAHHMLKELLKEHKKSDPGILNR